MNWRSQKNCPLIATLIVLLSLFSLAAHSQGKYQCMDGSDLGSFGSFLLTKYPNIINSNYYYQSDYGTILVDALGVARQLGGNARLNCESSEKLLWRIEYGEKADYSAKLINNFRTALKQNVLELENTVASLAHTNPTTPLSFESVLDDLISKKSNQAIRAWLRLKPLVEHINNSQGRSFDSDLNFPMMRVLVDTLPPSELERIYRTNWQKNTKPVLSLLTADKNAWPLTKAYTAEAAQFYEGLVQDVFTWRQTGLKEGKTRSLGLEDISGMEGMFRGDMVKDCSTKNLPYYSLHKDVTTYAIIKSGQGPSSLPLGVELVVNIEATFPDGQAQKVPYILALDGPHLHSDDARIAIAAVDTLYGNRGVILPHVSLRPVIIAERLLKWSKDLKSVPMKGRIQFPENWELLNAVKPKPWAYYYDPHMLENASYISSEELNRGSVKHRVFLDQKAEQTIDPDVANGSSLFSRALFAAQLLEAVDPDSSSLSKAKLSEQLGLTESEVASGLMLWSEIKSARPVSEGLIRVLQENLKVSFEELLLTLKPAQAAATFEQLLRSESPIVENPDSLFSSIDRLLAEHSLKALYSDERVASTKMRIRLSLLGGSSAVWTDFADLFQRSELLPVQRDALVALREFSPTELPGIGGKTESARQFLTLGIENLSQKFKVNRGGKLGKKEGLIAELRTGSRESLLRALQALPEQKKWPVEIWQIVGSLLGSEHSDVRIATQKILNGRAQDRLGIGASLAAIADGLKVSTRKEIREQWKNTRNIVSDCLLDKMRE